MLFKTFGIFSFESRKTIFKRYHVPRELILKLLKVIEFKFIKSKGLSCAFLKVSLFCLFCLLSVKDNLTLKCSSQNGLALHWVLDSSK